MNTTALDVWFKFDTDLDEYATHEANCYRNTDGTVRVEWCLTSVGLLTTETFDTHTDARAWLETENFQDFTA